jgi:hypothetical protein
VAARAEPLADLRERGACVMVLATFHVWLWFPWHQFFGFLATLLHTLRDHLQTPAVLIGWI